MDYLLMLYGALGFVVLVAVAGGVVIWRRKKKKKLPEEIYPMW